MPGAERRLAAFLPTEAEVLRTVSVHRIWSSGFRDVLEDALL